MDVISVSALVVEDVHAAIDQIAQTTLRKVVGQHTLDETPSETDQINLDIRAIHDIATVEWGVEVTLGEAADVMMAHPIALQLRNLQSLVELGVDKNTTVVFPAPLMSAIAEIGTFLERESAASHIVSAPAAPLSPLAPAGVGTIDAA